MNPKPIRAVFFGNGFTRKVILPCLRHVEGIEPVGLASPNQEKARETAERFGIAAVSNDHREILTRTKPDLVFVVTPPHRHLEQSLDAIAAGCHVVCEKPTAMTAGQSAKMLEAARAAPGQLCLIDHELRLDPRRRKMRQWVTAGDLGEIHHASYTLHSYSRNDPMLPWTWWSDAAQGGGALGALGSHAIDALRLLLGEIDQVRGFLHTFIKERPDPEGGRPRLVTSDDYASAWLRFRSGALATLSISMVERHRQHRVTVSGSRGSALFEEQQPLRATRGDGTELQPFDVEEDLPASQELGIPDTDWARNFIRLARRIVEAIRNGESQVAGLADFEEGHRNQLVLDAIRRSHETARWIDPCAVPPD